MYLPAIDLYTQFALRTAIILACCVIVTGFLLWSKIALILFPKATDRNDPTRGFEILTALGHNDHVIRSVLGSKSGSESRRHEPVRVIEIEKITVTIIHKIRHEIINWDNIARKLFLTSFKLFGCAVVLEVVL